MSRPYESKYIIQWPGTPTNKIWAVKAIRKLKGWGLKEAKEWAEQDYTKPLEGWLANNDHDISELYRYVENSGGQISDTEEFGKYKDDLKEIVMKATLADDTIFAEQLLRFINGQFKP